MLGIKADSVPFPLRKKEIGKKQVIVVHQACQIKTQIKYQILYLKAYVFLKIYHWHCKYVRKPKYHFKWTSNEILILLGSQIVAKSALFRTNVRDETNKSFLGDNLTPQDTIECKL